MLLLNLYYQYLNVIILGFLALAKLSSLLFFLLSLS